VEAAKALRGSFKLVTLRWCQEL